MICCITLDDVGEDQWMYRLIYDNMRQEPVAYPLPFEEMGALERTRFVSEMFAPAFLQEQERLLDSRPVEIVEKYLDMDMDGEVEDDEEERGDVEPQHIIDILNNLASRIEDLEIKLNSKGKGNDSKE